MSHDFQTPLATLDPVLYAAIQAEYQREADQIELIASENIVSRAVLQAQGSIMTNKYAEGYPGKRYYGGCVHVDTAENLARDRLKALFGAAWVNVQPHSGSQANQAVFYTLLKPGDKIMGMALDQGGHLTHGSPANISGKWFQVCSYGVHRETELIDYDALAAAAAREQPKLIIAGGSAYPRQIDFAKFRAVADSVGAKLLVDMAHFAGLVAAGAHPNPVPVADVVTSTTHKTLRGPRGGIILSRDEALGAKLNSMVFPGLQGGPLMHVIAAKAVAFAEALTPAYKNYIQQVVTNARVLADTLQGAGLRIVSGGTDTHLLLVDLQPLGLTGKDAEKWLEEAGLTCNKNGIPFDPQPPTVTSGIRLGSPAGTSRGFGAAEFTHIGDWIATVLKAAQQGDPTPTIAKVRQEVQALCRRFPIYPPAVVA